MSSTSWQLRLGRVAGAGASALLLALGCAGDAGLQPAPSGVEGGLHGELKILNAAAPGFEGLGHAVVYLEPEQPGAAPAPQVPVPVRHTGQGLEPELVVAAPGQPLEVTNTSGLHHRLFWLVEGRRHTAELLPGQGASVRIEPGAPGVVRFYCELHREEYFSAFVAPSRHVALLDASRAYAFEQVPPGEWRLHLWSERVAGPIRVVEVASRRTSREDIWIDARLVTQR